MSLFPPRAAARLLLLAAPAWLAAQEISSSEELRLEALARAASEIYVPRNNVTVGMRILQSGAKVHFGNLGVVPFATTQAALSDAVVARQYDNGYVLVDGPRSTETDADGIQTSTPGGRYHTSQTQTVNVYDSGGNVVGTITTTTDGADFLAYTPGLTRAWSYTTPEQAAVRPGYIALSSYSTVSDGASLDRKQGMVGGVELNFSRILGRASGRIQWSLLTGISLTDINNKINSDVNASLVTRTDFYSLNGQTAPALPTDGTAYVAPSNPTGLLEDTVPISQQPNDHTENTSTGAATVHGKYQVKGAYFLVRLGPAFHAQISEHIGISGSLGLAGAYAGTLYTAVEKLDLPNMTTSISTADPESSFATKFVGGYYADLSVDLAANETTALYAGLVAQRLGDYDQTLGLRTARIDLGTTVGLRGGVTIKF
ncbi:MAG TPA: hypothetical protein VHD61_14425 [Lacunisphaera sp.]|nr:hypothetical protein [Lacunisphaera sp.]